MEVNAAGQAQGVTATLEAGMIGTGTKASQAIKPPGFMSTKAPYFDARGHLLAKVLGGSGHDKRNLVTLTQRGANSPEMRDFEKAVAGRVREGEVVEYSATPLYRGGTLPPSHVLVTATGSRRPPTARLIRNPAGHR